VRQTVVLAIAIVAGALLVAIAIVSLNAHVRALSDDVAALTHQVRDIGEDVKSLADDVATITDSLTEEDGAAGDDETCPADIGWRRPAGASGSAWARASARSAPRSRRRFRGSGLRP
jgi:hypothetical protein